MLFQAAITSNIQKIINFFGYLMAYFRRHNPVQAFANEIVTSMKEFFNMNRKAKMVKYRLNYQMYKLNEMEQLIAENNEHVFLRGNKLNLQR